MLVGDIYEFGALLSVRALDLDAFERYFAQLKTFYTDYKCACAAPHCARLTPRGSQGLFAAV